MQHEGEPPQFLFRVVSHHRTALNRQIKEAVSIRRRGGATSILNSKAEYNRCYVPRLVVEVEDEEAKIARKNREEEEIKELQRLLDEEDMTWEIRKHRDQELGKKKRRRQSETEEEPKLTNRCITDFYKPTLPVIMEGVHEEIVWEEDDLFDAVTTPLRNLMSGARPRPDKGFNDYVILGTPPPTQ